MADSRLSRRQFLTHTGRLALGVAATSLLAGCGSNAGGGASTPGASPTSPSGGTSQGGTTTISMMGWGSPLEKQNVQKGLDMFQQQHPDIKVKWIHVPQDYFTKLKTALAGGTPPDVFWTGNLADYVSRGVVMDITSYVEQDPVIGKPDYFLQPQEKERSTINGKWFGIGSCWVIHHLYYNSDILEKAGVEPPSPEPDKAWTWEEFLENCRKLTVDASGKHPGQPGFDPSKVQQWGVSWPTWSLPRDVLVFSNGGEAFTPDYKCHLGEPEAMEAIQALADLAVKHQVAPQAAQMQQLGMSSWQMLASGKLAILVDGSWALQDISKMNFKFGCGVLPKMKKVVTEAQAHCHVICSRTKHLDAAWQLLRFLSSDDYQLGLCKAGLWLPSHTSLLTEDGLKRWITPGVHPEGYDKIATEYLLKYSKNYFYPAGFEQADQILTSALDPVWIGKMTVQEAFKKTNAIGQVNQVLQQAKAKLEAQL